MKTRDHYQDGGQGDPFRFEMLVFGTLLVSCLALTAFIYDASRDVSFQIDAAVQRIGDACQLKEAGR